MIRETQLVAFVAVLLTLGVASCDREGPAERAGEKVDHAVDTIKNGGEEPASDKLEDAADKAQDAAAEAGDAAKQAVEDAKEK
jgi:hyperosmotically inducible protein